MSELTAPRASFTPTWTKRSLLGATLVHLALVAALFVSLDWARKQEMSAPPEEVVDTVMIDASALPTRPPRPVAEVPPPAPATRVAENSEQQKKAAQEQRRAEQRRVAEQQKQAVEEQRRAQEQQRAEQLKKQQEIAAQQRAEAERKQQEAQAEQRRVAEERQRQEEEAKRLAAKRAAEERRQAAEARLKAIEEEQRQTALENEQRALLEQEAQRQAKLAAKLQAQQTKDTIARYRTLIYQKVRDNWIRPTGVAVGARCVIRIRLAPTGRVIDITPVKSSGDTALDRSVEAAVLKAVPLDVPKDPDIFKAGFQELTFEFIVTEAD